MCAFSGGQTRSSVLGVRSSALIRYRVSGTRYQVAGTRDLAPDTWRNAWLTLRKPAHRVCMMQDKNGQDSDYQVPGTWYLSPVPHSHISNLNRALLPYCPTALLPYCLTALLPYCLTALLPHCPISLPDRLIIDRLSLR
jgi:hypothetical protein